MGPAARARPEDLAAAGPRLDRADVLALVLFVLLYGAFRVALSHAYALLDEDVALEMLAAAPILHGGLPYVDAISHRGPWLSVVYAIGLAIGGNPFATDTVHFVCAAVFVLGAAVLYCGTKAAYGRPTAVGMLAMLLAIATCVVANGDSWVLNADALMASWIAMSLGLLLLDASLVATLGAGVLCALGFLTKQNAFPFLVAALPYLAWSRDRRHVGAWLAGVATPIAVFVLVYGLSGHLREMWAAFYEYNEGYATLSGTRTIGEHLLIVYWVLHTWGFLSALPVVGFAIERRPRDLLALSFMAAGVLAAVAPGRGWHNYLWAAHIPFALVFATGAIRCAHSLRVPSPRFAASVAAFVMAAWSGAEFARTAVAIPAFLASRPPMAVGSGSPPVVGTRTEHVATIQEWSVPGDTIYVNAYAPELYVLAERGPASRYVTTNLVERFYPASEVPTVLDDERAAELFDDLERNRPRIIVDACYLGYIAPPESALQDRLYDYLAGKYRPVAPGIFVRDESTAGTVAWSHTAPTCATTPRPRRARSRSRPRPRAGASLGGCAERPRG